MIGRGVVHTAAGVAVAWQLASSVEAFLFEVRPHDPVVYGAAAAFVPVRRAARVNPVIAMRVECARAGAAPAAATRRKMNETRVAVCMNRHSSAAQRGGG